MVFGLLLLFIGYIVASMEASPTVGYILMGLGGVMLLNKVLSFLKNLLGSFGGKEETAYWIQKTHMMRADEYECSSCGASFDKAYSRCPNCDLEMTKIEYDPSWVDEIETMDALFRD